MLSVGGSGSPKLRAVESNTKEMPICGEGRGILGTQGERAHVTETYGTVKSTVGGATGVINVLSRRANDVAKNV